MYTLVLVAVLVGFGATAQIPRTAKGTGVIAGQVVDATSGQPIAGAVVTLKGWGRIDVRFEADRSITILPDPQVVVDSQGRFVFASLGAGAYSVSATSLGGYDKAAAYVELGVNERITDVPVRLGRFSSINGTVRDDTGDPVVGTQVNAFLRIGVLSRSVLSPKGDGLTDDRGRFRIGSLPVGDYLICVCGRDPRPLDRQLMPLLGPAAAAVTPKLEKTSPFFAPTFHPASIVTSGATPITLGIADDRTGIDVTVRVVKPVRVSGQLQGASLNEVNGMTMLLIPESDLEALGVTAVSPVELTSDGVFEFPTVPPGRYSLEAFPKNRRQGPWASVPITVGDQDLTELAVPLGSGAAVAGRLEFSGSAARPTATTLDQARVVLMPVDSTPRLMLSADTAKVIGHTATVERDGRFRIDDLPPGRYSVVVNGFEAPWKNVETVRASADLNSGALVTVSESGLSEMVITMSDTPLATVQGTVVLDKYEAPQQARVVIFPEDASIWPEPMRVPARFVTTSVTDDRTFKAAGVPAGDYWIALAGTDVKMTPEWLETVSRRATRITLRAGEISAVGLKR